MKSDGADIVWGSPKAMQTQYWGQNMRIHTFKAIWTLNVILPKSILCVRVCVCFFFLGYHCLCMCLWGTV